MRKALFAVLTLSTLALPGCIFAIGTDRGDWEDEDEGIFSSDCCENCQQMNHVEHRVTVIERHLKGECKPDCPLCKKASAAKSEGATDSKAEDKPAAK